MPGGLMRGLVSMTLLHVIVALATVSSLAAPALRAQDTISAGSGSVTVINFAPYTSPFIGVTGGTISAASCPAGKIVVGVAGSRAKFMVKATPLCATMNKDGSFASLGPLDASVIGSGGSAFALQCAPASVVTRLRVAYHSNATVYPYIAGIEIGCSTWVLSQWGSPLQSFATTNVATWPLKAAVACTNNAQPMRALRVRATTAIKALGITCDEP